jgi:hypothetical protein
MPSRCRGPSRSSNTEESSSVGSNLLRRFRQPLLSPVLLPLAPLLISRDLRTYTHPNLGSDPALYQLGALLVPSHRDGETSPAGGYNPGGAYQYGYAGGGKLCGRPLATGVIPELPVTRVFTTKEPRSRRILSRPVKKGLLQVEVVCPLAARNYKISVTIGVSATMLTPVSAILDTGAGPNMIRETVLPEDWERFGYPGFRPFISWALAVEGSCRRGISR